MAVCPASGHYLKVHFSAIRLFLVLCVLFPFKALAQTTHISGVVNTYHTVTQIIYSQACVRIDNTAGLANGDKVLVIQMKGASVNTANNSSFGDTTSLNDAGNYEVATICTVGGDSVFFYHNLMNTYTVGGKVQLVKFGEYYAANVTDTIKAAPWNNSTGKGGVIALYAERELILNAPVYADASGYAGGAYVLSNGTCSNFFPANGYVYDGNTTTPQNGAFKGEGVCDIASANSGGRGAPANGGGGGNNHNNGGGGGANLSNGGMGGGNFSTTGCTGNYRGLAGKALSSHGGKKLFMGGGGGAGHSNNNTAARGGGNGGGIIIIIADSVVGNGYKISANGQAGGNSNSDAAGGGGAGGTIILSVNSYSGSLTVEANGGKGGDADNDLIAGRCYGAGGGGAGGVLYFKNAIPAITYYTNGGAAGINIDNNGCGAPILPADGSAGSAIPSYSFASSVDPSDDCPFALATTFVSFDARLKNKKVELVWESTRAGIKSFIAEKSFSLTQWEKIKEIPAQENKTNYSCTDDHAYPGIVYYRIKMLLNDHSAVYSGLKKINIPSSNQFTVFPNPATGVVVISGKISSGEVILLHDITGKTILKKNTAAPAGHYVLYLNGVSSGVYFVKIRNEVFKLIIR